TKRWQTIKNPRLNTISNRYYFGPFTFNADTLWRVDFPGGYFDGSGKIHYNISDWQGAQLIIMRLFSAKHLQK
ncbi:MAG: hypothetical protein K2F78_03545, partial [Muribaculaceae bacterium]|nr:hypothetical protein [Muribaculaceae bacterium]